MGETQEPYGYPLICVIRKLLPMLHPRLLLHRPPTHRAKKEGNPLPLGQGTAAGLRGTQTPVHHSPHSHAL